MSLWGDLNTPDNFKADWYGELTNQCGHTLLGILSALTFCDLWFVAFGSMPFRSWAFMAVFVTYSVAIEWRIQKWKPGDSWFDSLMFGLGAAGAILPVREIGVDGGGVSLEYSPVYRLGIMAVWVAFLFFRVRRRYVANKRQA